MAEVVRHEETVVRRSRGMRALRVLVLLGVVLAVLLLALIGGVQLILMSDIPRARIVHELQKDTGLRFEAAHSRTRWAGITELRDVSVALPLDDQPFVEIPVLRVRHTPVLGLAIGPIEVMEATLERPLIRLQQDDLGRWNVMRAVEIVQARQADAPQRPDAPPLPQLTVLDGVIEIPGVDAAPIAVGLQFEGVPETPLSWAFTLAMDEVLSASGRVAPHGQWQHQIEAVFGDDQRVFAALLPQQALPLRGDVHWRGWLEDGMFTGRLNVRQVQAGDVAARGDARFVAGDGRATLHPRGMTLASLQRTDMEARIASGTVVLDPASARIQRLRMELPGTIVELQGLWELQQESGEISVVWSGAAGPVLAHQGEATLRAVLPEIGRSSLTATIHTLGRMEEGTWDATLEVAARGESWQQMVGELTLERLVWQDDEGVIDASGSSARVETQWPVVRLGHAVLPGAERSRLDGRLNVLDMTWALEAEAVQWDIPRTRGGVLDLHLSARGDAHELHIPELRIAGAFFEARASGDYDVRRDQPLRAAARVAYRRPGDARGRPAAGQPNAQEADPQLALAVGAWLVHANVVGGLQPLNVELNGMLQASEVMLGEAPVEHLSIPFTGRARDHRAEFATTEFEVLGGLWQIQGSYVDEDRSVALQLDSQSVPLQSVAQLLEVPLQLPGVADGQVQVHVPGLRLDDMEIHGHFGVADIDHPHLRVERGRGELVTRRGVLSLRGLRLLAGDASIEGSLEYDLTRREDVHVQFESRAWPFSLQGVPVTAVMDGGANVVVDLESLAFRGHVDAAADVLYMGEPMGRLATRTILDGRKLNVQEIHGDFYEGTISGRGMVSLDDWRESRGELFLDAVDLRELMRTFLLNDQMAAAPAPAEEAPLGPLNITPEDFSGVISGELMLGPSVDPRAPEPLAMRLQLRLDDAAFRTVSLGDVNLGAYFGPRRSVLDRSTVELSGGVMTLWSRISQHNDETFAHLQMELAALDIDQLYRAFEPEHGPLPGRLSGVASFGGYTAPPHRLFGDARFALVDSDLSNIPALGMIYNRLGVTIGPPDPRGRGDLHVRMEGYRDEAHDVLRDALELTRLQYFNRGVDITAALRIDDVWLAGESPISGVAAGTVRPLRDVEVPLLDLDRLITGLQAGAASVEIDGTLADREVRVVPFADISARIGRILGAPLN